MFIHTLLDIRDRLVKRAMPMTDIPKTEYHDNKEEREIPIDHGRYTQ